ncbi:MAG: HAD-IIIA family hydrolase, partial [Fidelibacterota bacterium]
MRYEMIFLDRDGTLNPDPGYISRREDFHFFDFTLEALSRLKGNSFIIITNQSGVARGRISEQNLEAIHAYVRQSFREHGIDLKAIYVCTD